MATITVTGKALKAFDRGGIYRKGLKRAIRKGVSDSQKKMLVEGRRIIRESKALKLRFINRRVKVRRNTSRDIGSMRWGVTVTGSRTGLIAYPSRQTKKGVSVEVNRGQRKIIQGAFIATLKSGKKAVFRREKGSKRLPINELWGTRPFEVLNKERSKKLLQARGRSAFEETFERNFAQELTALK